MVGFTRQVSADSGVAGCDPHRIYPLTLDPELLLKYTKAPPNTQIIQQSVPQMRQHRKIEVDENNNEEPPKPVKHSRPNPIDYTYIALVTAVPAPFMGLPAFWFARKCKAELLRGDQERAWDYSWLALYFILAGLFCLCLMFAGVVVIIFVSVYMAPTISPLPITTQAPTPLSFTRAAQQYASYPTTPAQVNTQSDTREIYKEKFRALLLGERPLRNLTATASEETFHAAFQRREKRV